MIQRFRLPPFRSCDTFHEHQSKILMFLQIPVCLFNRAWCLGSLMQKACEDNPQRFFGSSSRCLSFFITADTTLFYLYCCRSFDCDRIDLVVGKNSLVLTVNAISTLVVPFFSCLSATAVAFEIWVTIDCSVEETLRLRSFISGVLLLMMILVIASPVPCSYPAFRKFHFCASHSERFIAKF